MILAAPLQGWSSPLDEAPDPVFADRMLGDGVAIDPTDDVLRAPCEADVVTVAPTRHAITLRATSGAEILLHVGIDTVALAGEGFELLTSAGRRVRTGEPLLRFDLDLLARRAKSVLTPVILLDGSGRIARRAQHVAVRAGDFLMELEAQATSAAHPATSSVPDVVRRVRVSFAHGIHARPAAMLVKRLREFSATVEVQHGDRTANARSVVALMSLGAGGGAEIRIHATGADAHAAVAALEAAIVAGEAHLATAQPARSPPPCDPAARVGSGDTSVVRGIAASDGIAVGRAVRIERAEPRVIEAGAGVALETRRLERACQAVRAHLEELARTDPGVRREIMLAHLELLGDPQLASSARASIAKGKSAGFAWRQSLRSHAGRLRTMSDPLLAERADDLLDLESAVLLELEGRANVQAPSLPEDAVLIGRDLLPSQLATLDAARLAGICLAEGGPTSHVALLAAALGVPMLVAAGPGVLRVPDGANVVLDAGEGALHVSPDTSRLQRARAAVAALRERRDAERAAAMREARTQDGTRVEIFANVGSLAEAQAAVANGAEGCGLLRTEFLFLDRPEPPDETEQTREYQRIADVFGGRPLVVRTLDAGGDKPIPYLPLPREANPALGLRGIRTSLWRADLLQTQLRAVLRVRPAGQCRILLPMIVSVAEVRAVRRALDEARAGLAAPAPPPLGVMVETPAAAMLADQILQEADFLSIGTNDLMQYALAMDRGHPELAAQLDGLHPAVLRLIAAALQAAVTRGRPVAICGALAADPLAVPILVGLGVRELSVVPAAIPALKALVRTLTVEACRVLAAAALDQPSAEAVRALSAAAARTTTESAGGRTKGLV